MALDSGLQVAGTEEVQLQRATVEVRVGKDELPLVPADCPHDVAYGVLSDGSTTIERSHSHVAGDNVVQPSGLRIVLGGDVHSQHVVAPVRLQ